MPSERRLRHYVSRYSNAEERHEKINGGGWDHLSTDPSPCQVPSMQTTAPPIISPPRPRGPFTRRRGPFEYMSGSTVTPVIFHRDRVPDSAFTGWY
jgi:hypothetical protein